MKREIQGATERQYQVLAKLRDQDIPALEDKFGNLYKKVPGRLKYIKLDSQITSFEDELRSVK